MPSAPAKLGAAPSIGHVYGKVVDSTTGKPIADVSVILLQTRTDANTHKSKDVLLKGMTTKGNGEFSFEELPIAGMLKLKITISGYQPFESKVQFLPALPAGGIPTGMPAGMPAGGPPSGGAPGMGAMPSFEKDLGKIGLATAIKQLDAVVVTATKPLMKMDIDKKTFNVEKNLVSAGGTALDVMRNVPSVQVDIDGNVKLRNSAPQLYIDGRPTTLSLDQIPSDAIESVEVITNPSAKYDASGGTAGILNIVLKKNRKTGYNGNLMAGVDRRGALNGGGSFNVRQGKINLSASAMGNQMKNRTTGTTSRLNFGDDPETQVYQINKNKTNGGFLFGRLGLDYFVTNKTTLSFSATRVHGEFKPSEVLDTQTDSLMTSGKLTGYSTRNSNTSRTFNGTGFQMSLKHDFAKEGESITIDGNYFSAKNNSTALYATDYFTSAKAAIGQQQQKVLSDGKNTFFTVQADYVKPFTSTTKLEAGVRGQFKPLTNNNETYIRNIGSDTFVQQASATNNYKNTDNVYAAYASFTSAIKNFGYQVGLRAESSNYNGDLTNTGQHFKNSYPISLFPSVFLSQKLSHNQELQLSYTRRINRPNFFQLIPYTDYTDSLNITKGNPNLVPEFTNSLEFSYGKTFNGTNNLLASIYYKHTNDLITSYLQQSTDEATGKESIINTYVNASSSYSYGAELTSVNKITRWWDMTTNVNVYRSRINTSNVTDTVQAAMWSWFGKWNNTFTLPSGFSIQLSGDYQSKTNLPVNNSKGQFGPPMSQAQTSSQGYIRSFYGVDIAVKKTILKNKGSITLSASDLFRTRKSDQYSESAYFTQNYYRLSNPQMVKLNFTYMFGKMDVSLFKRKSANAGSMEGMQMQ